MSRKIRWLKIGNVCRTSLARIWETSITRLTLATEDAPEHFLNL